MTLPSLFSAETYFRQGRFGVATPPSSEEEVVGVPVTTRSPAEVSAMNMDLSRLQTSGSSNLAGYPVQASTVQQGHCGCLPIIGGTGGIAAIRNAVRNVANLPTPPVSPRKPTAPTAPTSPERPAALVKPGKAKEVDDEDHEEGKDLVTLSFKSVTGQELKLKKKIAAALEKANEKYKKLYGTNIPVSCAYRCPEHNTRVGGSETSNHLHGLAFDINYDAVDKATPILNEFDLVAPYEHFTNRRTGKTQSEKNHFELRG